MKHLSINFAAIPLCIYNNKRVLIIDDICYVQ